jgi:hypothetical protein
VFAPAAGLILLFAVVARDVVATIVLLLVFGLPLLAARWSRRSFRGAMASNRLAPAVIALAERRPHAALADLDRIDGRESALTIATGAVLAEWARADGAKGDVPRLLRLPDHERERIWGVLDAVQDGGRGDEGPATPLGDVEVGVLTKVIRRWVRSRHAGDGLVQALTVMAPALFLAGRREAGGATFDQLSRLDPRAAGRVLRGP